MSAENGKVCCNCRHCIRERNEETLYTKCRCEISGVYLSYQSVMGDWCRHWAKEQEGVMTNQEKDRIECAIRHIQTAVDVDPWAVEIAVEAMEKQIPKKPKKIDHWRLCPTCYEKNGFSYDYLVGMKQRGHEDISYCLGCGQAIDWEGE